MIDDRCSTIHGPRTTSIQDNIADPETTVYSSELRCQGMVSPVIEKIPTSMERLQHDMRADPKIGDDLFFFPEYNDVEGFSGTGNIWFVGLKRSRRSFPDTGDTLLYETLSELGLANAHLTHISKERGLVTAQGIEHTEIQRMRPYFRQELDLCDPSVIIGFDQNVYHALKYMAATDDVAIRFLNQSGWLDGRNPDQLRANIQSIIEDADKSD